MSDPTAQDDLPLPWPLVESRMGEDLVLFKVRHDWMKNPRTEKEMKRLVLETRDWVNIVAYTKQRELLVVRQFRFGSREVATEIPGGVIDPGETHEETAKRELREETGYTTERWTYLGCVQPNPAFHDNLCHHWLAEDCERTHDLDLDDGEDLRVGTLTEEGMLAQIHSGEIKHSLVISALSKVIDLRPSSRTER